MTRYNSDMTDENEFPSPVASRDSLREAGNVALMARLTEAVFKHVLPVEELHWVYRSLERGPNQNHAWAYMMAADLARSFITWNGFTDRQLARIRERSDFEKSIAE